MPKFSFTKNLVSRFKRNDFEYQVQSHIPVLMRIARGLVIQPSDAEDLVHDTCVKALSSSKPCEFETRAKLGAWLNRILVNTYRDQYRRARHVPILATEYHATSNDTLNVVELVANTEPCPLQSIENRNSSRAIYDAISLLPPEVRVVSVLFLINGLSYKDIAYITNCPIGTVMSRLARGRQLLKRQLADYDPGKTSSLDDEQHRGRRL